MKYVFNTRLKENLNFISYQIVYEKTSKITIKKKMINENNIRIKENQTLKENEREYLVFEYRKEQ